MKHINAKRKQIIKLSCRAGWKVLLLISFLIVQTSSTFAQGDDCNSATMLIASGPCLTGTTVNASESLPSIVCNNLATGSSEDDVWYKFIATSTSHIVNVTPITQGFDPVVDVRAGVCGSQTTIACADVHFYDGEEIVLMSGLTIGETYFVRIYGYNFGNRGEFTICVSENTFTNDDCANAYTLIPALTCTTTTGLTNFATSSGISGCSGAPDDDVWYKFEAVSETQTIHVNPMNAWFDPVVQVFSNLCSGSLMCMDANDVGLSETLTLNGLTPGNTYYARVYGWSNTQYSRGKFTICITHPMCQITCPPTVTVPTLSGLCDVVVNYPPVAISGSCSVLSYSPADGSSFHVGTTAVNVTTLSGQTCTFNVVVTPTPTSITTMQGPSNVCRGTNVTYCVQPVQGAVSYNWTIPNGTTGSSTNNCITLNIGPNFVDGVVIVTAFNACNSAASAAHLMDVALAKPAKPANIHPSNNSPACAGTTKFYCAQFVPGVENWVFTIGGNGGNAPLTFGTQINSCIEVNIPAGYNNKQEIKVRGVNCKGQGDERKLDIKTLPVPATPGNINGPGSVCLSQLGFYNINNVNNATQYNWSVTNDVWIAGGQGSNNIALDFSTASSNSSLLSVTAENGCGVSAPRTKTIVINTACREGEFNSGSFTTSTSVDAYPNPTSGRVTLEYTVGHDSKYSLMLYDMTGRVVLSRELNAIAGLNTEELDLTSLPKQMYLLNLKNENESRTIRIGVE